MRSRATAAACCMAWGVATAVHADCMDWQEAAHVASDAPALQVRDALIKNLMPRVPVELRMLSSSRGFGHHERAVVVRWRDDKGNWKYQDLLSGLASEAFARLRLQGNHLVLVDTQCEWQGPCRAVEWHCRHDKALGQFTLAARNPSDWGMDDSGERVVWHRQAVPKTKPLPVNAECAVQATAFRLRSPDSEPAPSKAQKEKR